MNPNSNSTPPSSQDLGENQNLKPSPMPPEKTAKKAAGQRKKPINWESASGMKFGRLTVVNFSRRNEAGVAYVNCTCNCGNTKEVKSSCLVGGQTQSCGCFLTESNLARCVTHGKSKSSEFAIWSGMRRRCVSVKDKDYHKYGGRGITVCERWLHSFANFYQDMGDRPFGTTLDRIDNNGNYCPENCRWATDKTQARNRRTNLLITFNGVTKTLAEWAEQYSLNWNTLRARIMERGWSIERALTCRPIPKKDQYDIIHKLRRCWRPVSLLSHH